MRGARGAPPRRRLAAGAVDLPFCAAVGLVLILGFKMGVLAMPTIFVVLTLASWGGRSPGMLLAGLTVVDVRSGRDIDVIRAAVRALVHLVAIVIAFWVSWVIGVAAFGVTAVLPVALVVFLGTTGLDPLLARWIPAGAPWDVATRTVVVSRDT